MSIIFAQSKECEILRGLAKENKIKIAIPQYSLVEVEGKAFKKIRKRGEQLHNAISLLNRISESTYNRDDAKIAKKHIKAISQRVPEEEKHISEIMGFIRKDIVVIPHSETILVNADLRFQSAFPPFKESDCKIYEAWREFIRKTEGKFMVFTQDREDFDYPEIHKELQELGCVIYFNPGDIVKQLL